MKSRLLVIDDDEQCRAQILTWLSEAGYEADQAASGLEAMRLCARRDYDAVLLDLRMDGMSGLEVMEKLREDYPDTCIIVMSAFGVDDDALEALREGALDFIDKNYFKGLKDRIKMALAKLNEALIERDRRRMERERCSFDNIIGQSRAMKDIFKLINKIAGEDVKVLITGENGTGKDLIARSIHHHSLRGRHSLVLADCGALAETLIESELFGHERGAFTDARTQRKGVIERADKSTLFINEIGELSLALQKKFLTFLDTRQFQRLGGERTLTADVRIIAATNRDLEQAVESGEFRRDLFYRINVMRIHIPPLRERREDIPLLVEHFLKQYGKKKGVEKISEEAAQALFTYSFPGNVRELEFMIESGTLREESDTLSLASLAGPFQPQGATFAPLELQEWKSAKTAFEKTYITRVLARAEGNISLAAEYAGMDRNNFKEKMKHYGLGGGPRRGRQAAADLSGAIQTEGNAPETKMWQDEI